MPDANERLRVENFYPDQLMGGTDGANGLGTRWTKWESQAAYAARMRRYSTGMNAERAEWNGETLEREVMMSAAQSGVAMQRGREKHRRSRGDLADLKEGEVVTPQIRRITPMTLGESVVSGTKSPVPRRAEAVEQGLLAMKLRGLKLDRKENVKLS